jgi:hypothetical protein
VTGALEIEQEAVKAGEWERDRKAWNLPRPTAKPVPHGSPGSTGPIAEPSLDWQGFLAAHFPGRQRHDLEALVAYSAYRRRAP